MTLYRRGGSTGKHFPQPLAGPRYGLASAARAVGPRSDRITRSARTAHAATPLARPLTPLAAATAYELSCASSRYTSRVPPQCAQQRGWAGSIGSVSALTTSSALATIVATFSTSGKRRHSANRASR